MENKVYPVYRAILLNGEYFIPGFDPEYQSPLNNEFILMGLHYIIKPTINNTLYCIGCEFYTDYSLCPYIQCNTRPEPTNIKICFNHKEIQHYIILLKESEHKKNNKKE